MHARAGFGNLRGLPALPISWFREQLNPPGLARHARCICSLIAISSAGAERADRSGLCRCRFVDQQANSTNNTWQQRLLQRPSQTRTADHCIDRRRVGCCNQPDLYVFPAIELVGRHGSEIIREQQKVYVTEPANRPLLSALLKLRGGTSAQVDVLPDDINILKRDNIWILWSPTRETEYPELIEELDNRAYPKQLYPLGIGAPENWWFIPSAQPVLSFLYAGTRKIFDSGIHTYPNLAPYLAVHPSDNVGGNPENVADRNFSSAISWLSSAEATIDFHLDNALPGVLSVYRLVALNHQSMTRSTNYSWKVMGQLPNGEWVIIDTIKRFPLSQDIHEPSWFTVSSQDSFRKIRFHFLPEEYNPDTTYAGLNEIELYFSP